MAKIEGLSKLTGYLKKRKADSIADDDVSGVVGYTAAYAAAVHENLEALHGSEFNVHYADKIASGQMTDRGPKQQAKFLEEPARRLMNEGVFKKILEEAKKQGMSLRQGIQICVLRLQRESMMIVPVETGNLRGSCFASVESGKGEKK